MTVQQLIDLLRNEDPAAYVMVDRRKDQPPTNRVFISRLERAKVKYARYASGEYACIETISTPGLAPLVLLS